MTIAKQLNAKAFPFCLYDANGYMIYFETSDGFWVKYQRDSNDNVIYSEDSDGFWMKREFDAKDNVIYSENSKGYIEDNRK